MARFCDKRIKCTECPCFRHNNWGQFHPLEGIDVCEFNPDSPEVLICEKNAAFIKDTYKKVMVQMAQKYEDLGVHRLVQKRMNDKHLEEKEREMLALWDSYGAKRSDIPPLENIAIANEDNRDIRVMLCAFFDEVAKILLSSQQ